MNRNPMRIILLGTATVLCPAALFAQDPMAPPASGTQANPTQQVRPSTTSIQDSTVNSPEDTAQLMKDRMFLRKAAEGGLAEIQLGQLALQKAGSDDVKAFGHKMVDDHTALNIEMAPVAQSRGVKAPTKLNKEDQAEYDKLNGLSGDDFDKEYLAFMVRDHHKDLHEFRAEAANTSDPVLKAVVEKGSKVIYGHMTTVDKLARDKGVAMPGRNRPVPPPVQ